VRLAVWPADDGGCGYYRMAWPARALIDQGVDIDLRMPGDGSGLDGVFDEVDGVERLVGLHSQPDFDVLVLQRPLDVVRADVVGVLQQAGVRVVVEIDDCFETIHPRNTSWRSTHPRTSPHRNRDHLARACRQADLVVCTTAMLAHRYGRHGRVAVVPNYVPARYLDIDAGEHRSVGWTGSLATHPTDLQVTRGAVARAVRDAGVPFRVVGTGAGVRTALGLDHEPQTTGWVSLDEYPERMAETGVGIVPLDDIAFNHAKSALKMMEYAALGVPAVASPTADNVRMHAAGIGLMAAKPKHWYSHLRKLLASAEARADLAGRGREVMAGFTIENNAHRWLDAWASVLDKEAAA
jgi:glycosyltransferase involved in cell wall biosynthesis